MIVHSRSAAPFFKNGFVIACDETREAVIVDPGDEVGDLLQLIASERLAVRAILLTHGHVDHVAGVKAAKAASGAPVGLHAHDLFLYEAAVDQGRMFGYRVEQQPPPDFFYETDGPGATIAFGRCALTVHHTPGHSPGGVCLMAGPPAMDRVELFVGDTLFAGSIGRTDLPGGDYETLMRSIRTVLLPFGDAAVVHPGHGPDTTIGAERESNPFLRGKTL